MNEKRTLIISLAVAVGAVVLVNLYVASVRADYASDPVIVLQASRDISAGQIVAAGDYKEIALPRKLFETVTAYAVGKQDSAVLLATPLRRQLRAGEVISYSHISRSVGEGLRDAIPVGKRAVSIPVSEETSVSNFVQPGDVVDIIATLSYGNQIVTKPLLTGVRVLAAGGELADASTSIDQRGRYNTVTLELTVAQAEYLVWARDQAKATMTLLLRNPKDHAEVPATPSVSGADVLAQPPR